jgi:hypothetical protein
MNQIVSMPGTSQQINSNAGNALMDLPRHLQGFASGHLPSLDEWVLSRLTSEQKGIYRQLLFARLTVGDSDAHVVDFDLLWVELGYSTKQMAKRNLEDKYVRDVDYILLNTNAFPTQTHTNRETTLHGHGKYCVTSLAKDIVHIEVLYVNVVARV